VTAGGSNTSDAIATPTMEIGSPAAIASRPTVGKTSELLHDTIDSRSDLRGPHGLHPAGSTTTFAASGGAIVTTVTSAGVALGGGAGLLHAALPNRVSEAHPARKQKNFFTRAALARPVDDNRATIERCGGRLQS
jgi:hypothetical protein